MCSIAKFNIENIQRIKAAAISKMEQIEKGDKEQLDAYKISRLVCLENLKVDSLLSEVLWL